MLLGGQALVRRYASGGRGMHRGGGLLGDKCSRGAGSRVLPRGTGSRISFGEAGVEDRFWIGLGSAL